MGILEVLIKSQVEMVAEVLTDYMRMYLHSCSFKMAKGSFIMDLCM